MRKFNCKATSNFKGTLSLSYTNQTPIERKRIDNSVLSNCCIKRQVVGDFLEIATQRLECDFIFTIENITEWPNSHQQLVVTIKDTKSNYGLLRIPKSFRIPSNRSNNISTWYLLRNANFNFYDKEKNIFLVLLAEHSSIDTVNLQVK